MPKYLLTYHGEMKMEDMPSDPDAIAAMMAVWGSWYESMGAGLVDGGAPISMSTAIDANGSIDAPSQLSGYGIIEAADMDAATEMAKGCPVLPNGHSVQISHAMEM